MLFEKVLIANRGEIAVRIQRACKEMGIKTVAVHSVIDRDAMHVRLADESVCVGPASSKLSYMNMGALLSACELTGAQAIHPGFGFLSENATFAQAVQDHGIVFIGPTPEHIRVMGDKVEAKKTALSLGLQTVPGSEGEISTLEEAHSISDKIGYPVLIKASAGGGGRGMRVCHNPCDLKEHIEHASAEAQSCFGHSGVYIEKFLACPRHIEFQILGDHFRRVLCLGERDCSVQRRHQKIWEEALCPVLTPSQRNQMYTKIIHAMERFGYQGLGTLEFLYEDGNFYFIEMNTRVQVEHPVTEMIYGLDLIRLQLQVAQGIPLSYTQDDLRPFGHAIECRINAEDPENFCPSPGKISAYAVPGGPFVRVDSALFSGYTVPSNYDSLISKLVVWGITREECIARMRRALHEYVISGIRTLIPLHLRLCDEPDIQNATYHIKWLESYLSGQNISY
ncbi:biotin carboxylase [Holospora obtusa F1]|uniref:Biotin carboxylase n=1 Tax=Holospora obtusa F1 TaxID=1399147 RepID=W6TDK4_HOLOB|nr:biotin carboxylase [Holospora obtusa F1]